MALYRDEGIVIRTQKLGEADRIITLFTREHGRVRAVAKGVRRTKSKFGARLEPASHVDIQLYTGKTFDVVTQVEAVENYGDEISSDYQKWTIASSILEAAERFSANEGEPALQQFLLLAGALKALAHESHDPSLILDAYLLRSLSIAGYAPSMTLCSRCEAPGPHKYFSLVGGGSVCADCKPSASATPAPETLTLMSDLLTSNWDGADQSQTRNRREASGLIAAYLQWHLERGLKSLPMVERASS
ncbi:MAG: DNA repair protein RecO [Actinobacteria bacterium]|nr:DNA repair protein RecO [Actinomycetota bacterium]NCZ73623.1 DNA repair protein RecO [Actinomycetota bacterium]NDA41634.1 DNA repair protein RecO [Actinomycetota bacterium]NDB31632.1 DNA repair protein RecO [Actinomycetota bacterium]NDD60379.1 DNA repair protein RecO [Actinomycetota bacterium]